MFLDILRFFGLITVGPVVCSDPNDALNNKWAFLTDKVEQLFLNLTMLEATLISQTAETLSFNVGII